MVNGQWSMVNGQWSMVNVCPAGLNASEHETVDGEPVVPWVVSSVALCGIDSRLSERFDPARSKLQHLAVV